MFGSVILEIAAGLTLIFLILSAACSAIREVVESWMKLRAVQLERTLREMLGDPTGKGPTLALLQHPLIRGLFPGVYDPEQLTGNARPRMPWHSNLPSYIPGPLFAQALLDLMQKSADGDGATSSNGSHPLNQVLQIALEQTDGSSQALRDYLENWYDSAMERTSGWYKRNTQTLLFLFGLLFSVALNVDALRIADALYRDDNLRQVMLLQSETPPAATLSMDAAKAALTDLRSAGLPMGWTEEAVSALFSCPSTLSLWLQKLKTLLGWLITALAVSQCAPFWYDLLNRITSLRSTIKPDSGSASKPR